MSVTLLDFKTRLQSKIHSGTLNKVQDVNNLIYEAACNLLNVCDPVDTIRKSVLTNAVYDDVYSYAAPSDLKDDKVIDIRPQVNRTVNDNFNNTGIEQFDLKKDNNSLTVEYNSGVKTLRISKTLTTGTTLNDASTTTENGTWTAGGDASNLEADSLNKVSGSASLKFDLDASGSAGYIVNSTMTAVDLSNYVNTGALFVYVYIPDATAITAIRLDWGSDSSNYYYRSVTASHDNTSFTTGWNLLRFDWSGSTPVGTSVNTAITYAKITFTYDGTATPSCRVDNIVARLGSIYEIVYYSNYLFRNAAGTWQEKPTADSDYINLGTTGINALLYECAQLVSQELSGFGLQVDIDFFSEKEKQQIDAYIGNNKSQAMKKRSSYYSYSLKRR